MAVFVSDAPAFLKASEVVEGEIEGIGALRNEFRAPWIGN